MQTQCAPKLTRGKGHERVSASVWGGSRVRALAGERKQICG